MPDLSSGMDFLFDSAAALVLFAACVTAWALASGSRASSRINIRFAAMLLAALAAARALGTVLPQFAALAPAVALLAASLGTTALALGLLAILARPLPPLAASLGLALALGAGLAAALSGEPVYALGCQSLGVAIIDAVSVNRFFTGPGRAALALLVAQAFFCAGLALMDGAINFAELFFAAGLIGAARASQLGVEA